jgi:penicillin-binding protein 2
MKRRRSAPRLLFIAALVVAAMTAVTLRLWHVQIVQGDHYASRTNSSSKVSVRIPAVRGEILDRNGIKLVENRASFEVDFYLPDMVRAYLEQNGRVPMTTYRGRVHNMPRDLREADVVKIVSETVIPRLRQLGMDRDYNPKALRIHYRTNREVPFNYRQDLSFEEMAVLSEKNLGLAGVNMGVKPVRWYVYGSMASHLLGYVGAPSNLSELPDIRDFTFYEPDVEGKAQLELHLDSHLKGQPGARILQRNAKGVIEGEVDRREPVQGDNVHLTIDAHIQYIAEKALRVVGRGAAVVLDPRNGDILAMASVPSYDPNVFIPSIPANEWKTINADETNPLVNRAISAYAPGSTYKIPIALAGMLAGIDDSPFTCHGGVQYGKKYMRCWIAEKNRTHGSLRVDDAIKVSCNAFFYLYGNAAGIDHIVSMGEMLGLGSKTGIPVSGESAGVLPGPSWLQSANPRARWTNGLTANTAIGQGDVLSTPLQMAVATAAVANGGKVHKPRLVDKIVSRDGTVVSNPPREIQADLVADAGLTTEQIDKVRQGMWKVVNEGGGTARKARNEDMPTAGKTGTAQFWRAGEKDNHAWFISFAPYDNPEYVVVTFVQGAKSGGGVAAPIAAEILKGIHDYKNGEEVDLSPLPPAEGNFLFTESIDFGRTNPVATMASLDEETSDTPAAAAQENIPQGAPNLAPATPVTVARALPATTPEPKRNPVQSLFKFLGGNRGDNQAQPPGR